jgi:hypothetical protein
MIALTILRRVLALPLIVLGLVCLGAMMPFLAALNLLARAEQRLWD